MSKSVIPARYLDDMSDPTTTHPTFTSLTALLDQAGIGYEVIYPGPGETCPIDHAIERAA
jgi:hypothetical protein